MLKIGTPPHSDKPVALREYRLVEGYLRYYQRGYWGVTGAAVAALTIGHSSLAAELPPAVLLSAQVALLAGALIYAVAPYRHNLAAILRLTPDRR